MKCIVTAIFSEAKAFIELFGLEKSQKKPFEVYQNSDVTLIVSGMGKLNSAIATTYISQNHTFEKIYNIGICGTNDKTKEIGRLYGIKSVIDASTSKKYSINQTGEILYCFDMIQKGETGVKKPALVDMESFGFYSAAIKFYKKDKICIYKIVSDHLDTTHITNDFIYRLIKKATKELPW